VPGHGSSRQSTDGAPARSHVQPPPFPVVP
jgi:hypothetical protein